VIDPEVVRHIMARPRTNDPLRQLTASERQLLALMAEGLSNVAIARRLNYSLKTVEKRITSITRKLGLPCADGEARAGVNLRVLAVLTYLRGLPPTVTS